MSFFRAPAMSEPASRSNPPANILFAGGLLLYGLLVLYLRSPELFAEPRFWAEEATLYFRYAAVESWWRTILFVPYGQGGYLSLSANVPALLASRLVALEHAPAVTTAIAALVLALPVYLIAFGRSLVWRTGWQKLLAVSLYLFAPIHPEESWLNSINSMSYLGIVSLIVLAENVKELPRPLFVFQALLLFYNGLSAVYTVFLAPAFLLKAILFPGRRTAMHSGVVTLAALIQVAVVVMLALNGALPSSKFQSEPRFVKSVVAAFEYHVVEAYLGPPMARRATKLLDVSLGDQLNAPESRSSSRVVAEIAVLTVLLLAVLVYAGNQPMAWVFLLAFLFESFFSSYGAMKGVAGGRYAIVPKWALLSLTLVAACAIAGEASRLRRTLRAVAFAGLAGALVLGSSLHASYTYLDYRHGYPRWKEEVAQWRNDNGHLLRVWPNKSQWAVLLTTRRELDALRAFAERVQDRIDSREGEAVPAASHAHYTAPISEIPLEGRLELTFDPVECKKIDRVEIEFSPVTPALKIARRPEGDAPCSNLSFLVKGQYKSEGGITGSIRIQARHGEAITGTVLHSVQAYPGKQSLF